MRLSTGGFAQDGPGTHEHAVDVSRVVFGRNNGESAAAH
jgi:hypothetical protein